MEIYFYGGELSGTLHRDFDSSPNPDINVKNEIMKKKGKVVLTGRHHVGPLDHAD